MKIAALWLFFLSGLLALPLVIGIVAGINLYRFDAAMQSAMMLPIPAVLFILGLVCWKKAKAKEAQSKSMGSS